MLRNDILWPCFAITRKNNAPPPLSLAHVSKMYLPTVIPLLFCAVTLKLIRSETSVWYLLCGFATVANYNCIWIYYPSLIPDLLSASECRCEAYLENILNAAYYLKYLTIQYFTYADCIVQLNMNTIVCWMSYHISICIS
jgi:hypothetical protein